MLMRYYLDGRPHCGLTQDDWATASLFGDSNPVAPFDQSFYVMANMAIGDGLSKKNNDKWVAGNVAPAELQNGSIRIYQCGEDKVTGPINERACAGSINKLGYVPLIAAQRMRGSRSCLILAINDRERSIAGWQMRQGTDWVDQMLLGGILKCAEHGYRMIFELVDARNGNLERGLGATIAALQTDDVVLTPLHSGNPLITEGGLVERCSTAPPRGA